MRTLVTIGLSLGILSATPALAALLIDEIRATAPQVPEIRRHKDWLVVCDRSGDHPCFGQPASADITSAKPVAISVVSSGPGKGLALVLRAPLEVLLPSGAEITIDGQQIGRLAFQLCDNNGCVAPSRLSGDLEAAMRRGTSMTATVTDVDGNEYKTLQSLIGVTSMLNDLSVMTR